MRRINKRERVVRTRTKIGESSTIILKSCTFWRNSCMCTCKMSKIQLNRARFFFKLALVFHEMPKISLNCVRFFRKSCSSSQLFLSVYPPRQQVVVFIPNNCVCVTYSWNADVNENVRCEPALTPSHPGVTFFHSIRIFLPYLEISLENPEVLKNVAVFFRKGRKLCTVLRKDLLIKEYMYTCTCMHTTSHFVVGSFQVHIFLEWGGTKDLGKSSGCFMIIIWPIS